ncbi:hypothetical protein BB561_003043 [Smittium simulii]|uniref:DASH complex subunit DUO1 n=1 Tax=Smittium simulii TaxID=133385 RepID=A0A2T9YNE9_9FUNG|nr:hypothetical protein BB561_003043 [Smittium simulii]
MDYDKEQEQLEELNKVFTRVTVSLDSFLVQLKNFNANVNQTSQLLDLWADILAQTTFNYNIISEPGWEGGSQDKLNLEQLLEQERLQQEQEQHRLIQAEFEQEEQRQRLQYEVEQKLLEQETARKLREAAKPPGHPSLSVRSRFSSNNNSSRVSQKSRLQRAPSTSSTTTSLHKRSVTRSSSGSRSS